MHLVSNWQMFVGVALAVILGWTIGYCIRMRQFRQIFGFPLPRKANRHLFKARVDDVIEKLAKNSARQRILAQEADMGDRPYPEVSRLMEERYALERRVEMAKEVARRFGFSD